MRNEFTMRVRLGLMGASCGVLLAFAGVAHAQQAQDDDEDTFEQRIIKGILGGIGVDVGRGPGINYRERSPLVIPPSLDLPPPDSTAAAAASPAWPREQVRKKITIQARTNVRAGPEDPGTSAAMTPDELRRAPPARSSRITDPSQSGSVEDPNIGRPSRPNELGGSSIFNMRALMGDYGNEQATFDGEPGRGVLTQPPPGYQTPSPSYPYGVNADTRPGWKIPTILSRPEGVSDK